MSTKERDQKNNEKSDMSIASRKLTPLMTVDEVAHYLTLEPDTVRAMARNGDLPAIKLRRVWRFKLDEINMWIQQFHN